MWGEPGPVHIVCPGQASSSLSGFRLLYYSCKPIISFRTDGLLSMLAASQTSRSDGGHTAVLEARKGSAWSLYKKTVSLIPSTLAVLCFSLGSKWPSHAFPETRAGFTGRQIGVLHRQCWGSQRLPSLSLLMDRGPTDSSP